MGQFYSDTLEKAIQLIYLQGDVSMYPEGVALLLQAVDSGERDAYYYLGRCYGWGDGDMVDDAVTARKLMETGMNRGSDLCILGAERMLLRNSQWKEKEPRTMAQAYEAVKKMAEAGDPMAQYTLGDFYCSQDIAELQQAKDREEIEQNKRSNTEKSLRWYKASAEQGCIGGFKHAFGILARGKNGLPAAPSMALQFMDEMKDRVDIPVEMYAEIADLYYNEKKYKDALYWLENGLDKGCDRCCNTLGTMYRDGVEVQANVKKAFQLFERGAQLGECYCQYNLGKCYKEGVGVQQDAAEAFRWFSEAAEGGHVEAKGMLAWCYDEGEGVRRDYKQCFEWASKAVEEGDFAAKYFLGKCYLYGQGVPKDYALAKRFLEESVEEAENDFAYQYLGEMYDKGLGVEEDMLMAIDCYRKAAAAGYDLAEESLAGFKRTLLGKWKRR